MSIENVQSIITAIRSVNGMLKDENLPMADPFHIKHVGIFKDGGDEHVVPVFDFDYFPINSIDLNFTGNPYISAEKLGKPISTKGIDVHDLPSIDNRISCVIDI